MGFWRKTIEILVGILAGLAIGWSVGRFVKKTKKICPAHAEYWIYLPGTTAPPYDAAMDLVMSGPIGPAEGLLFSDIRLNMDLVLRSKNPREFRPDLFGVQVDLSNELLNHLNEAKCFVRVRFVAAQALTDDRHLVLLPYLAYAFAKLGDGFVVYDPVAESLFSREDLQAELKANRRPNSPDVHVRTVWIETENGGRVETRGLVKKGIWDFQTDELPTDQRMLGLAVVQQAASKLWAGQAAPTGVDVEYFGDSFRVMPLEVKADRQHIRILRQVASPTAP